MTIINSVPIGTAETIGDVAGYWSNVASIATTNTINKRLKYFIFISL